MHTMLLVRQLKLKKEKKNINLTDQTMWSSVLRREAYIKYCTHANNLELAIAQHNTWHAWPATNWHEHTSTEQFRGDFYIWKVPLTTAVVPLITATLKQ